MLMSEERNELCPWDYTFLTPRHRSGRITALNRRLKAVLYRRYLWDTLATGEGQWEGTTQECELLL